MSCGTNGCQTNDAAAGAASAPAAVGALATPLLPPRSPHPLPSVTLDDVRMAFPMKTLWISWPVVEQHQNHPCAPGDNFDAALEAGKRYMVGADVPTDRFMRQSRSPLTAWQKKAFEWARQHPDLRMSVEANGRHWEINMRGDYVEFVLPYHDAGGERAYITQDGRSKFHINED
jgi:hypothetical protein